MSNSSKRKNGREKTREKVYAQMHLLVMQCIEWARENGLKKPTQLEIRCINNTQLIHLGIIDKKSSKVSTLTAYATQSSLA